MKNRRLLLAFCLLLTAMAAMAEKSIYVPRFFGTLRSRYEYLIQDNKSGFKVRNFRLGVEGKVAPIMSYLGEVDFADWHHISLVNAFAKVTPIQGLDFVMGQMRIPFTIAAHRLPGEEYFVNRPFLSKFAGIRDVGIMGGYKIPKWPLLVQASFYNNSGAGPDKNFFTNTYGFSAKLGSHFHPNWYVSASTANLKRGIARSQNWDVGAYFDNGLWHVEGEYLYRHYMHSMFKDLNTYDVFVYRNFPIEKHYIAGVSGAVRYDYMGEHTTGTPDEGGVLIADHPECHRLTVGATLALQTKFQAEIRVNYEKYFLKKDVIRSINEEDRLVLEIIACF